MLDIAILSMTKKVFKSFKKRKKKYEIFFSNLKPRVSSEIEYFGQIGIEDGRVKRLFSARSILLG